MPEKYTLESLDSLQNDILHRADLGEKLAEAEVKTAWAAAHAVDLLGYCKEYNIPLDLEHQDAKAVGDFIESFFLYLKGKSIDDKKQAIKKKIAGYELFYYYNQLCDKGYEPEIRCVNGSPVLHLEELNTNDGNYDIFKITVRILNSFTFKNWGEKRTSGNFNPFYSNVQEYLLDRLAR